MRKSPLLVQRIKLNKKQKSGEIEKSFRFWFWGYLICRFSLLLVVQFYGTKCEKLG